MRTNDGKYHTVYVDNYFNYPSIYYTHSTTSIFTGSWTDETLYRNSLYATDALNPSIDYYSNNIYCVYEKKVTNNNTQICFSDDYMTNIETIATVSGNFGNCKPVIAVTNYGSYLYIFIAWKPGSNSQPRYSILKKTVTGGSVQTLVDNEYIPNTTGSSKNLSIAVEKGSKNFHLVWEVSSDIKYQLIYYHDDDEVEIYYLKTISSGGGGYKNHYPSISLHEENDPIVTWTDSDEDETVIRYNNNKGGYYNWKTFYFCGNNPKLAM
ncbi:hypothetical protein KAH27_10160 [bacterium]|nr:hypothetical protein [bacterium]